MILTAIFLAGCGGGVVVVAAGVAGAGYILDGDDTDADTNKKVS